jgi:subtilisin family serine protease
VKAIRWAVAKDASVINMSLGGLRDPNDSSRDTFSRLEAEAIEYAVRNDVVVVAAVGNADQAPSQPWKYASWPASLPHVLGVSALARNGTSPTFSNRVEIYNDVAAPGLEILSSFPLALTALRPTCVEQGYSSCGPGEYQTAEGTSFATPQVSAAAATLLATLPDLTSDQVVTVLERSAVDAAPASGCARCLPGRDALTGWGRLDVTAALGSGRSSRRRPPSRTTMPARHAYCSGDEAGVERRWTSGTTRTTVYPVYLRRGQRLFAALAGTPGTDPALALWRPGTREIDDLARQDLRVRLSAAFGPNEHFGYRAPVAGWYFLHVKLGAPGTGPYRLSVVKT